MIKSVCIDSGWVKSFFTSLLHNLLFLFSNRNWKSFCQFYKRTFWQKHYNCEKDMKFHKSGETTRSWEDYPWWYWLFSLCINNFHSNLLYVFSHNSCWSLMMTVIISFQQANERLLGPSSHVVEVGVWRRRVNISRKCCRAGRAPGTDCRRSRSDWGHSGRCLCPVLLSPPGFSSDTLEC